MIKFYYHPSPNPAKVALFLEEAGLPFEVVPIDTRKGEQFAPEFLAINPNAKTPAITDGDVTLFDSSAILLFLAKKTGRFIEDKTDKDSATTLSWLMFIASGVGPYSGQAVHFAHFAPEPKTYAVNRYLYEAERHWKIIDTQLGKGRYMMGEAYTILDMSVWGWARAIPFMLGKEAWTMFPSIKRLVDEINARPAAAKVNELAKKHEFKQDMDESAKKFMFPANERLAPQA